MSFLSRIFGRKPPPPHDRRQSNDWRPGDLAVCVADNWSPGYPDGPGKGDILRVAGVHDQVAHVPRLGPTRSYFLSFVEKPRGSWEIVGFRKVVADTAPAEAEFTALVRRPVRVLGPELAPSFDDGGWKFGTVRAPEKVRAG